jgi:hypothetical protein
LTVTAGLIANPAIVVLGCTPNASLEALAGLTAILLETEEGKVPEVKVRVMLPELVTNRPLKVATPLEGVAVWVVVVAFKLPPLVSLAVMAVA